MIVIILQRLAVVGAVLYFVGFACVFLAMVAAEIDRRESAPFRTRPAHRPIEFLTVPGSWPWVLVPLIVAIFKGKRGRR